MSEQEMVKKLTELLNKRFKISGHFFHTVELDEDTLYLSWSSGNYGVSNGAIGWHWVIVGVNEDLETIGWTYRYGFPFHGETHGDRVVHGHIEEILLVAGAKFPQPWHDTGWSGLSKRQKQRLSKEAPHKERLDLLSSSYEKWDECICGRWKCQDCRRIVWKAGTKEWVKFSERHGKG